MQKIVSINAKTLDDCWFQVIYNILKYGRDFKIDSGSYAGSVRKELDFVVLHIERPWERSVDGLPLIPVFPESSTIPPPVTKEYISDYAPYLLTGEVAKNESYTYGSRLNKVPISNELSDEMLRLKDVIYRSHCGNVALESCIYDRDKWVSQVAVAIEEYKRNKRTNQMCLEIGQPSDITLLDPPCLRLVDTRIQDGKLMFFIYFRSWDAWGGLPANLCGLSMLQEHMASEIGGGIEQGEMICTSKGLHLYDYAVSFAQMRCMVDDQC